MTELGAQSLSKLLLRDDSFLPLLMNWAVEEGWTQLLLFWLEIESLTSERSPQMSSREGGKELASYQPKMQWALTRIIESYELAAVPKSSAQPLNVQAILNPHFRNAMKSLINSRIPLQAVLASICDIAWQKMTKICDELPLKVHIKNY
jgi:hypothetical protein